MLKIQEKIAEKPSAFESYCEVYGLNVARHSEEPWVILNYDQIGSQKTCPVARECRATCLNLEDNSLIYRSFSRFFNWGEVLDEQDNFNFSNFIVQEKLDGSLCIIKWYKDRWLINTRGSWEEQNLEDYLDKDLTYVCEFCSPWNKIVRQYSEPQVYLLTAFKGEQELHWDEIHYPNVFKKPDRYEFRSIEQIIKFLTEKGETDKTFEGVVIRDDK